MTESGTLAFGLLLGVFLVLLFLVLPGVLILLLVPSLARAECIGMIEFEIEDQFKEKHRHDELLGTTAVLVWADRKGSDFLDVWNEALEEALDDEGLSQTVNFGTKDTIEAIKAFMEKRDPVFEGR